MTEKSTSDRRLKFCRSALFVPAANERVLTKSTSLGADCLILDLEDSVAPALKATARENIRNSFEERAFTDCQIVIRINDLSTPFGSEDLMAALVCRPDAILLPKTSTPEQVAELAEAMDASEASALIKIWAMIETPLAILNIAKIAQLAENPHTRLACLVLGSNDLALETGTASGVERQNHLPWIMQLIAAGRAYHLDLLDGVYNDFRDQQGFERECAQSRELGFDGKTLIHPLQIEAANQLFSPTEVELEEAGAIIEAFSKKENLDLGVIQINGHMVERLHLEAAERLIARNTQMKRNK